MQERVYVADLSLAEPIKKFLAYDPYLDNSKSSEELAALKNDAVANVIFARQEYQVRDGASFDLDRSKVYVYIKANEEFFTLAEKKLKDNVSSIERADEETERRVVTSINEEQRRAESGIGSIFGGM